MIRKILNIKPGNSITRQYRNAKKIKAFSAANVAIATGLGYHHAKTGSKMVFVDMINILIFGRLTETSRAVIKHLKPEYNKILARKKAILKFNKGKSL